MTLTVRSASGSEDGGGDHETPEFGGATASQLTTRVQESGGRLVNGNILNCLLAEGDKTGTIKSGAGRGRPRLELQMQKASSQAGE